MCKSERKHINLANESYANTMEKYKYPNKIHAICTISAAVCTQTMCYNRALFYLRFSVKYFSQNNILYDCAANGQSNLNIYLWFHKVSIFILHRQHGKWFNVMIAG